MGHSFVDSVFKRILAILIDDPDLGNLKQLKHPLAFETPT
jgi:hypothetical protein